MNDDTQELIQENIRLTRENNRLLKKLWRAEVLGFWARVLFLAILIGVPVLLYQYYFADVVKEMRDQYQGIFKDVGELKDLSAQVSLGAVLKSLEEKRKELVE